MKKTILVKVFGVFLSSVITIIALLLLLFFTTVIISNNGKTYPDKATVAEIAIGNSDTLTADGLVLRMYNEETYDYEITTRLTELPQSVINAQYAKCNAVERTLVCFFQNERNTIISFVQENWSELTETTGTTGIDFLRVFGNNYIIVSCNTDSGHSAKRNDTFVVYKTDVDIFNVIVDFEDLSNYKSNYPIDFVNFLYMTTNNYYLFDFLWLFIGLLIFCRIYRCVGSKFRTRTNRETQGNNTGDGTKPLKKSD